MPERTVPTLPDQMILKMDNIEARDLLPVGPVTLVSAVVGLTTGVGTYSIVRDSFYPEHRQYQAVHQKIDQSQADIKTLQSATDTLKELHVHVSSTDYSKQIGKYQASIAEAKATDLGGYNPHVEGMVSGGGAFLAALLVARGLYRLIGKRANYLKQQYPIRQKQLAPPGWDD